MTFTTFNSYINWCIENESLSVYEASGSDSFIILENLKDTETCVAIEALLSAYDSGFTLGAFTHNLDNGSIIIYE